MTTRRLITLGVPVLIVLVIALVVTLAPEERSLGAGIKSVYVHVALTWTGMLGLTVSGLLGIGTLLSGRSRLERWAQTLGWVAVLCFASGFVMSMIAARVNWGAVFWAEPRTTMALQIISVAVIAQVLCTWIQRLRVQALLHIGAAAFMTWRVVSTELVLHPQSPILTSDSTAIQLTFAALFILVVTAAGWIVWRVQAQRKSAE